MPLVSVQQEQTPIVDKDGRMNLVFKAWVREVTKLNPIIGSGSPEGVVEADIGRLFIDESADLVSPFLYMKQKSDIAGEIKDGWRLLV